MTVQIPMWADVEDIVNIIRKVLWRAQLPIRSDTVSFKVRGLNRISVSMTLSGYGSDADNLKISIGGAHASLGRKLRRKTTNYFLRSFPWLRVNAHFLPSAIELIGSVAAHPSLKKEPPGRRVEWVP